MNEEFEVWLSKQSEEGVNKLRNIKRNLQCF